MRRGIWTPYSTVENSRRCHLVEYKAGYNSQFYVTTIFFNFLFIYFENPHVEYLIDILVYSFKLNYHLQLHVSINTFVAKYINHQQLNKPPINRKQIKNKIVLQLTSSNIKAHQIKEKRKFNYNLWLKLLARERESLPRFRGIWGRICCCCCCRELTVDREKVGVVGIWEIFEIGDLEEGMEPRKWKKTAINLWYSPACPRTRRRRGNRLLFYFTWPYPRVGFMFSRQLINHSQSVFFFFFFKKMVK